MTRLPFRPIAVAGLRPAVAGLLGLAALLGGCNDAPTTPAAGNGTGTAASTAAAPKKYDVQPAVLLSSRGKDGKYIVAIDFANSKAVDPGLPLDERRAYVLEQAVALYAGYAKKEKPDQVVRLLALSVPNRDEYARGDFKNMDELAVIDTVHGTVADANKSPTDRAGKVEWRKGLGG